VETGPTSGFLGLRLSVPAAKPLVEAVRANFSRIYQKLFR